MADMSVGSLTPYTFEALVITFLYDVDVFFQTLTVSLACMNLPMVSIRAISLRRLHCLNICLKCNLVYRISLQTGPCLGFHISPHKIKYSDF